MSIEYLGGHFDIHTGGVDHIPVHHTNEIAQSQAYLADGQPWVRWWMHGDFINLSSAKISKSAGGGLLVSDLIARGYHPLVYRYMLLQAHYRSQIEFSWPAMDAARTGLRRLLDRYAAGRQAARGGPPAPGDAARRHRQAFAEAIRDDLNTPRGLAAVAAASRDDQVTDAGLAALAAEFDAVLGLGLSRLSPDDLDLRRADAAISEDDVQSLVDERDRARAARDFARSDQIREELARAGVAVEDQPGGTSRWRWS